ncbi:MAG: hypothetical protein LBF89_10610 [Bacteroidales bacterium]|jgi:hypothetical protein|nr:hypothetical protein [Bacteroidales bacterium]
MKTGNFLVTAAVAAMMIPSCQKDGNNVEDGSRVAVRFGTNIAVACTKASGNTM